MSEHLFDLGEVARIARETHSLDAWIQYTGFGTYSVWVGPVVDEVPIAMVGPGNQDANAEGPILSRAVDLTVETDEYNPSDRGSAADMGLTTEAEVADLLTRVVREHHQRPRRVPASPTTIE